MEGVSAHGRCWNELIFKDLSNTKNHPGSGKLGGIQLWAPGKVGEKRPLLRYFGVEECRFPVGKWEQDRVFCTPVGGLGRGSCLCSPNPAVA